MSRQPPPKGRIPRLMHTDRSRLRNFANINGHATGHTLCKARTITGLLWEPLSSRPHRLTDRELLIAVDEHQRERLLPAGLRGRELRELPAGQVQRVKVVELPRQVGGRRLDLLAQNGDVLSIAANETFRVTWCGIQNENRETSASSTRSAPRSVRANRHLGASQNEPSIRKTI
jgi:hypothetical protein